MISFNPRRATQTMVCGVKNKEQIRLAWVRIASHLNICSQEVLLQINCCGEYFYSAILSCYATILYRLSAEISIQRSLTVDIIIIAAIKQLEIDIEIVKYHFSLSFVMMGLCNIILLHICRLQINELLLRLARQIAKKAVYQDQDKQYS